MAKQSGLGDRLYVNGYDLSGDVGAIQTLGSKVGEQNVTGIDKDAMERLQLLHDAELTFNNFFTGDTSDTNNEHAHERLRDLSVTAMCTYLRGTTPGNGAAGLVAKQFEYSLDRQASGALLGTVNAKAAGGSPLEWGVVLGEATFTGTGNGTVVDLGAAHGIDAMALYLHALAFSGTSATVIVQTDDNSGMATPSTYGTFAAVDTAHDYERLYVASAPERYIRLRVSGGTFSTVTLGVIACPVYT